MRQTRTDTSIPRIYVLCDGKETECRRLRVLYSACPQIVCDGLGLGLTDRFCFGIVEKLLGLEPHVPSVFGSVSYGFDEVLLELGERISRRNAVQTGNRPALHHVLWWLGALDEVRTFCSSPSSDRLFLRIQKYAC